MFNRFTAFQFLDKAGHRRAFWLGGPLLLYLWTIPGPFVFDDLNLLRKTERYIEGKRDRLDLFRFAPTDEDWRNMRSRGTYPWWAPDTKRIDFQRPLPEWSFWLDVRCFDRNPIGPRIESLALFAIALLLLHRMFTSAGADALRAGLATFFVGASQCLAQPAAFVSNRSDLFMLIGLALAGAAYFHLGRRLSVASLVTGVVGFVIALMSKEPAVAFAGVIVLHAVLSCRRAERSTSRAQAVYAAVVAILAATYLIWYAQTSHGGLGPIDTEWMIARLRRLALYPTVWVIGLPIAILPHAPQFFMPIAVIAGVVSWLAIAHLVRRQSTEGRSGVLFFSLWMLAFVAPALLTVPESRALSIATVGWAWILTGLLMPENATTTRTRAPSIWTRQWFLATNGIVSVCCGIGTLCMMQQFELDARGRLREAVSQLKQPLEDGDTLLMLEAKTPFDLICAGDRLAVVTRRHDVHAIFLTLRGAEATIHRTGERSFLIRGSAPGLFDTASHRVTLGGAYRPRVGDTFELNDMTFRVDELNDRGEVIALTMTIHDDVNLEQLKTEPSNLLQ
ncbi:MAG TPA: hypothetical protein P5081_16735 [Phycisphaerae bacterium]|nr:hypothetical protein [Phycisphaerae bacterium]HRW54518.1 hypothetical protein [Phycisphaerae bacterium]